MRSTRAHRSGATVRYWILCADCLNSTCILVPRFLPGSLMNTHIPRALWAIVWRLSVLRMYLELRSELDPQGVLREKKRQSLQCWAPCCRIQPWPGLSGSLCHTNPAVRTGRNQPSWMWTTRQEENWEMMQERILSLKGTRPRKSLTLSYGQDTTAKVKPTNPRDPWCILWPSKNLEVSIFPSGLTAFATALLCRCIIKSTITLIEWSDTVQRPQSINPTLGSNPTGAFGACGQMQDNAVLIHGKKQYFKCKYCRFASNCKDYVLLLKSYLACCCHLVSQTSNIKNSWYGL